MLRVPIRKDISEYKSKTLGKMTTRTLATVAAAFGVGVGIGAYMYFALGIDFNYSQWVIFPVCLAIWAIGCYRPMGFDMEQFLPLWIQHELTTDKCEYTSMLYLNDSATNAMTSDPSQITKAYSRLRATKGIEALSPSETYGITKE